jgi:hypothetical protein
MDLGPSTLAGLVTSVATVLTALATILGALPLLIKTWRQSKEIHTIVNQQRTDQRNYQAVLIRALENHGIDVPDDQSVELPQARKDENNGRPVL